MKRRLPAALCIALLTLLRPCTAAAGSPPRPEQEIKPGITQPYIVKPGDTLWDIADHFFRDPERWLEIWEHNLSITNPDLIYPGNRIWFDVRRRAQGGLTTVRPHPEVVIRPVQREPEGIDPGLMLTMLARHDRITNTLPKEAGRILDAADDRLHFGRNDLVYLRMETSAKPGEVFDIFRRSDEIREPDGRPVGTLLAHVGQLQITSRASDGIYRARITRSFEEIGRGDFLLPAATVDPHITPTPPRRALEGRVVHIRDDAAEAGQNQVVVLDIGSSAGAAPGTRLAVYRAGRNLPDGTATLPPEKIAELIVISPQQAGSFALVTASSTSINIGDIVRGTPSRTAR
ncbi:MAG: LysM domain-containing protein [Zetaproteobacteria bacterium]|nr:MAG: LysM domain-containing protein [Zetaproteobacteria bacterium]